MAELYSFKLLNVRNSPTPPEGAYEHFFETTKTPQLWEYVRAQNAEAG